MFIAGAVERSSQLQERVLARKHIPLLKELEHFFTLVTINIPLLWSLSCLISNSAYLNAIALPGAEQSPAIINYIERSTMMKRISIMAMAWAMVIFFVTSGQAKQVGAHRQVSERAGKVLVKQLPAGLKGVQLKGNRVIVKPGYKFVKQADGSVAVVMLRGRPGGGGLGVGGKWDCACDKTGGCETTTSGSSLSCSNGTCKGMCTLYITTSRFKVALIRY